MRKCFFLLLLAVAHHAPAQQANVLTASQGKVRLAFSLDASGQPTYAVSYNQKPVIKASRLGIKLVEGPGFDEKLAVIGSETKSVDETWKSVWGEVNRVRNQYQQLTVHLRQPAAPGRRLDVVFRVFADGVGFRYEFPQQPNLKYFVVADEITEFSLTGNHKTFWIPADYDTNEYPYTTSPLSEVSTAALVKASTAIAVREAPDPQGVQTPLMLKTAEGLYVNIHEAALVNYSALQLHVDPQSYKLSARLVPDAVGNKAYLHAPDHTPWRTIIVSNKATDILASKLILNLNEPSTIQDPSWIKPMKFVGVWWEMQTGKSTWSYAARADTLSAAGQLIPSGQHGANTANVKRYIDFAAKNGIPGVLVEGWNTGWEDWFGNWKENVFDFVTPYPDFSVGEVTQYAAAKGVRMIMHNETSGSASNYERRLEPAYQFMNQFGYPAVKTGYVGRIVPRGEHHDGQWMVNHYVRVAETASKHRVMVDMHESVRPTGLHRTFPNWLANEAGRGNEFNAFSEGNPPNHETILPFTRLMGGPMDYTPGIFKLTSYAADQTRRVHTTLAKQLALYVTLYSPLRMVADLPENYERQPAAFQFIKDVPVDWNDTRVLEAEPGQYVTIARQEKGQDNWFIGAITNETGRTTTLPLSFLTKGKKYTMTVYADADNADWKSNPEAYKVTKTTVGAATKLPLRLAPGGGAAVSIVANP